MAIINRDISRSRKAYSYFRPRPIYRAIATEEQMNNVNDAMKKVEELNKTVNSINASTDSIVWNEIPTGIVNGVNSTFILNHSPELGGKMLIFINGVLQERHDSGVDYNISGRTIMFSSPPRIGSKILVTYAKAV
jgi:hypothetical protein